jgi:hypothetical protein
MESLKNPTLAGVDVNMRLQALLSFELFCRQEKSPQPFLVEYVPSGVYTQTWRQKIQTPPKQKWPNSTGSQR